MSYLGKKIKYFAEIDGVDITVQNLVWNERGKARAGSFSFEVWDPSAGVQAVLKPSKLFELWIGFVAKADWATAVKGDLTKLAGILKLPQTRWVAGTLLYECEGVDRSAIAHNSVINASYTAQRPDQIVQSAWTTAGAETGGPSGITFANVATAGSTIDEYRSDYKTLFTIMEEMADATGWIWRLDATGDLHFKPSSDDYYGAVTNEDTIVKGTARFRDDATNLANRVWVFGSVVESDLLTENFLGDANQHTFKLGFPPIFEEVAVRKGGVGQTAGRETVNDFTTHDVLVNPVTELVRFDPASPPGNGVLVEVDYKYGYPVITRREDFDSISEYGLHEHVIVDAEIQDTAVAAERARAHLREFGQPAKQGEFEAYKFDIRAGQSIRVTHSLLSIDRVYTVDEVDREIIGPEEAVVTIKVRASPGEQGLQDKIRQLDQRVAKLETKDIPEEAPVNTFQGIRETVTVSDALTETFAAPESRVGFATVGYSQTG